MSGAGLLLNKGGLQRFLQTAEALGFVGGRLLLDNILLGGFDGLGFAGDWLFGDWFGWHGKKDICPIEAEATRKNHRHPIRGVIAESVPKRTLSGIEERGARISQRPKPILERFGRPDVVAIEADVFPAERANVGEQRIRQSFALGAKLGDGVAEIDGVPEGDGGDREVESRGPVALVFEGAVPTRT